MDPSFDFQYERPFGANLLDVHGTYIHEKSNLGATFLLQACDHCSQPPELLKLDSTYHWTNKYTATGAFFSTTGNADPLLYAPAPLTGSNNGSPDTQRLYRAVRILARSEYRSQRELHRLFQIQRREHQLRRRKSQCFRQQHRLRGLVAEFLGDCVEPENRGRQ